jgi:exo-beta-1,3-glucanase (GH17 family)
MFALISLALAGCGRLPSASMAPLEVRPFAPASHDAVCYGPHRDGQRPGGSGPSTAQLHEDLGLMASRWRLVRTYGAADLGRELLAAIRAGGFDLKVLLGVWISPDEATNRREAEAAIALAREYPDLVAAVCVGNETQVSWSPNPLPLATLLAWVREVRASVAQPVTAADDYQYWLQPDSALLAREVDFITMHAHPLWNGRQLDEAVPWLAAQVEAVRAAHPDRPVVIGETGWATSVADHGEQATLIKGAAGEAEQAAFYAALREWVVAQGVTTFVFEAFDENWKGGDDPAEVEKHWGLYRADRTPKPAAARLAR